MRNHKPSSSSQINLGSDYTPDEIEFLRAIDAYKRRNRRPFPTWMEVLAVLRGLGYRKCTTPYASNSCDDSR